MLEPRESSWDQLACIPRKLTWLIHWIIQYAVKGGLIRTGISRNATIDFSRGENSGSLNKWCEELFVHISSGVESESVNYVVVSVKAVIIIMEHISLL
jgi:hypothetical protein